MPRRRQQTNLNIRKQEQIDMLQGNCEKGILEQSNVTLLTKLINNAENEKEVLDIAQLGTSYKKTGLHYDKKLEKTGDEVKYFVKNEELSFVTDENAITHKLIIGDNYDALLNLLITHRGKIDVIYIDPPYGKDSMGAFAETNYDNAITRDNLLSMLYPRLTLAKLLLSDEGVIFVSIDDRNQAYVKCLMDEIFEERNFVACATCHSNPGGDKGDFMENSLQYILVYCKNKNWFNDLGIYIKQNIKDYPLVDEFGNYKKGGQLEKWGNDDTTHTHPNLAYSVYYKPDNGDVKVLFDYNREDINNDHNLDIQYEVPFKKLLQKGYVCIRPRITNDGENGRWRLQDTTFLERVRHNDFIFEKQDDVYKIYEKDRYEQFKFVKSKNFIASDIAKQNTVDLTNIFGSKIFDYAKPISLIKYVIGLYDKANITVLDFFAGSGTTGEAVLALNKKSDNNDNKRQFILVQLDEDLDMAFKKKKKKNVIIKNQIALCDKYNRPHKLTEITAERLRRVMTGKCYDGTSDFKWAKENEPYGDNLEVLEIAKVKNNDRKIFEKIDETLYGQKFEDVKDKIDWVCANFAKTQKCLEDE